MIGGNRERDLRTGFAFPESLPFPNLVNAKPGLTLAELFTAFKRNLDFSDIEFIRNESGLPVIVKGVVTPENARECVCDVINQELRLAMKLAGGGRIDDVTRAFVT